MNKLWIASFVLWFGVGCSSVKPPPPEITPPSPVLGTLLRATDERAVESAARLEPRERADFFNGLAWFDQRPGEVILTRDGRGMISRLEGPFLAHDHAPQLAEEPSRERAEAFFADGGLGRELLALGDRADLRLTQRLLGRHARFRFEQQVQGRRLFEAGATVMLDDAGRFVGLRSAGLVADPAPKAGVVISEERAVAVAIESMTQSDHPLWQGATPKVESVEKIVFDLFPSTGADELRYAYAVMLIPAEGIGGRREVVVDEQTAEILASIERAKLMLGRQDQVWRMEGAIGGTRADGNELVWTEELWNGESVCPPSDAPIVGTTPFERDLDETSLTFCETERFFADRGGEHGSTDLRQWLASGGAIPRVGIGAVPLLSIGVNTGAQIAVAEGAGRAEVVGHEFAHSLFSSTGGVDFGGSGTDGAAIEEHMADIMGVLLEQRMTPRNENRCMLSDDVDTIAAIDSVVYPEVPCRGQALPWRSLCQPWLDNGGWCEGPRTFLDKGFNHYDLGFPAPTPYARSHTNLGIGNRPAAAFLRPAGASTLIEGFEVQGLGQELAERLFLGAATELPSFSTWTDWGQAWIDAAAALDDTLPAGSESVEQVARAAVAGAQLWSLPRPMTAVDEPMLEATRATRPAVASIELADGRERTYIFYRRTDFDDRLYYVWRNEVAGGLFADESDTPFQGPCPLAEARSRESPTAVGSGAQLFVAWAAPADDGSEVGQVDGLRLSASEAVDAGCGDAWHPFPPGLRSADDEEGVERRLLGAPSLAIWRFERESDLSPPEEIFRCDPRFDFPEPPIYPRFPIGPLGPNSWSFDLCNLFSPSPQVPPQPLPPDFTLRLEDFLGPVIQSDWVRSIPSVVDPLAPSFALEQDDFEHTFSMDTAFQADPQMEADFENLLSGFGIGNAGPDLERTAFGAGIPHPDAPLAGIWFRIKYYLPDGPPSFEFGRTEERLVLAFRDPENRARVVYYGDPTATDRPDGEPLIPVVAESAGGIDPSLASVRMSARRDYLTVIYGAEHNGRETGLAYRVALTATSSGTLRASSFTAEERIDQIRGLRAGTLRRRVDYAYARTLDTPAVAGGTRELHLFVNELDHDISRLTPGDPDSPGYDPFPDTANRPSDFNDRVRYAVLAMTPRGLLRPVGERPVRLYNTRITSRPRIRSGRSAQVGAAQIPKQRRIIRFYFPNGSEVGIKSRVLSE